MNENVREDEQTLNCNHPSGWYYYTRLIYCKASADMSIFLLSDIEQFMKDTRTFPLSHFRSIHIVTLCYMKNMIVQFLRHKNLKIPRFVVLLFVLLSYLLLYQRKKIDEWAVREVFIIGIVRATPSTVREQKSKLFPPLCIQGLFLQAVVHLNTWLE